MQRADEAVELPPAQARMAAAGLKAMIPIRKRSGRIRPFLDHVLSALADAGCRDICLVVGPEHDQLREHYTSASPPTRVRIGFAIQPEPLGTASAVLAAETFAGSEPFLVLNADNYYPAEVCRALVELDGPGLPAFHALTLVREGHIEPDRLRSYAVLLIAPNGDLVDIIEKPDGGELAAFTGESYVSMNVWRFDRSIFDACRGVGPSPRGELELPNAVRHAIRTAGGRFRTIPVRAGVLDLSRRSDIAEVERRLADVEPCV